MTPTREAALESFWVTLAGHYPGPEHNNYYVAEEMMEECLKVMTPKQIRKAEANFAAAMLPKSLPKKVVQERRAQRKVHLGDNSAELSNRSTTGGSRVIPERVTEHALLQRARKIKWSI